MLILLNLSNDISFRNQKNEIEEIYPNIAGQLIPLLTSEHTLLPSAAHQMNPCSYYYMNYASHLLQYIQTPSEYLFRVSCHGNPAVLHPSSRGMTFLNLGTNDSSIHFSLEEVYSIV